MFVILPATSHLLMLVNLHLLPNLFRSWTSLFSASAPSGYAILVTKCKMDMSVLLDLLFFTVLTVYDLLNWFLLLIVNKSVM